ncbi:PKHD-type hydroxylase [Lutimaribacter pacificus]|uniref:PKHD-type hydroxylase n=1 Tax=Lutimaribacter pacificus TaxID=391948 RepID=A0A1H0C422_9RHOB|nr:Fe2+-dependent dioxygenase [Lutimaribacter pacificus]SDN52547.1 PKHD-type hydroxylase [Lutimaribacter pacificus]SHJ49075.1 PKHD-type hydroxylase [Lutimaribacter pacificus]
MTIVLNDILPGGQAQALYQAACALPFEDGSKTAGRIAAQVKDNAQATDGADTRAVLETARRALLAHPVFTAMAYPRDFARMIVSRTEGGGQYGDHVDNALMGGARTDLSFTLFLSPPDSYDGGELVIADRVEDRAFKPGQGGAVLYPSDTLHRVAPVTGGTRVVVVGWITSHIRDPRQREILFDLWQAVTAAEAAGDADQVQLLSKSRSNLLRMWAGL